MTITASRLYGNVLRMCKKEIDKSGLKLQQELASSSCPGFFDAHGVCLDETKVTRVYLRPYLSAWKTVIVEVSETLIYIGLDLEKSFQFRMEPISSYEEYLEDRKRDVAYDLRHKRYLQVPSTASDEDVKKASDDLDKKCRLNEKNVTVDFKTNKPSRMSERLGLLNGNLKFLPLIVFDYALAEMWCISDATEIDGYRRLIILKEDMLGGKVEGTLKRFNKSTLDDYDSFPWSNISFCTSDGIQTSLSIVRK